MSITEQLPPKTGEVAGVARPARQRAVKSTRRRWLKCVHS